MTESFDTFEEAERYCLSFISKDNTKERTLRRITTLMHLLGDPQKNLHVIHVTGSYGKSSTAYMIASFLEQTGLTVGLHIKPHLQSITERMCINRIPMTDTVFLSYVNKIKPFVETMDEQPTYFELLVAIMLLYFSDSHVDVAVIEVGRGGRLDATNSCDSEMLVLTNIFLMHTDILGNSKKDILKEKMGLARPRTKIIAGITQKYLRTYLQSLARPIGATVQFSDGTLTKNIAVSLKGNAARQNAELALLAATHYTALTTKQINSAYASMRLPARFEVQRVGTNTVIMDSANNREKIRFLLHDLTKYFPHTKMAVILQQKKRKDIQTYRRILKPVTETITLVTPDEMQETKPIPHIHCLSIKEAIFSINSHEHTTFLVAGSMQLIGSIRAGLSLPYTLK